MKIAITGSHSQGKSTLCKDLMRNPLFKDYTLLHNITRGIKDKGININELGSDWSQSLVIAKHIEHYFYNGDALLDRCVIDGMVYTAVLASLGKVSYQINHYAQFVGSKLLLENKYDLLFYVDPELPLIKDGTRTTDIEFFNAVVKEFNRTIRGLSALGVEVIHLNGSRENRVNIVINNLKEKLNLK